jgi:hypothetical protein
MSGFRLPDSMGGHRVKVLEGNFYNDGDTFMWKLIVEAGDESFPMFLPPTVLVEVAPPLPPPEPPLGTLLRDNEGCIWERDDPTDKRLAHWFNGGNELITWEKLWARGPLARMIPDPADTAPELPWHLGCRSRTASVYKPRPILDDSMQLVIEVERNDYTADEAEQIAAAILRAAREARAAT